MSDQPFISASQLSRRADIPLNKILKAVRAGRLQPDCQVNSNLFLFHKSKVDEARALFAGK